MKLIQKITVFTIVFAVVAMFNAGGALAKPPGAQVFEVYDNTQDGLQVATDPDIGNVSANANPGGASRLVIEAHLQKAAPNCTYNVELVRDSAALNGGLTAAGHTGSIQVIGTLTTNGAGNGNAHFDFDPSGDGVADTQAYGHLDFEDPSGTCTEADNTTVAINEYGAAPDPALVTPFNWLE